MTHRPTDDVVVEPPSSFDAKRRYAYLTLTATNMNAKRMGDYNIYSNIIVIDINLLSTREIVNQTNTNNDIVEVDCGFML